MQVVSFETAKRLKEAGFPQPEKLTHGQFYYSEHGHLFRYTHGPQYENTFFAPSATDILKELGRRFILGYEKNGWWCEKTQHVYEVADGMQVTASYNHENPAEACAAAWLAKNAKP